MHGAEAEGIEEGEGGEAGALTLREAILVEVDAFQAKYGLSDWKFGQLATRSEQLVSKWRLGAKPRQATIERVRRFMADYDGMLYEREQWALAKIERAGGNVRCDPSGRVSSDLVPQEVFVRLRAKKLVLPAGDALFDVSQSQTYVLAQKA